MRILLTLLLFPSLTFALSTVTRHVTPGCANNGDGTAATCAASAGAAGAYNSWANAESDIQTDYADFTSADIIMRLELHAGTANDTTQVRVAGVTTDATRYYDIVCDSGYKLVKTYADTLVFVTDDNVRITGCHMEQGDNTVRNFDLRAGAGGDIRLINNKFIGGSWGFHAYYTADSGTTVRLINNFFSAKGGIRWGTPTSGTMISYNNTCYLQDSGTTCYVYEDNGASDALYVKNTIANNCTSGNCWSIGGTFDTYVTANNITSDTDSPDGASFQSKTCTFVDTANDDLHLDAADTNCKDAGTDLSGDAQYAFSDDIDGETRSGSWAVGADELVASTPTFSVFEAIGAL